MNLTRRRGTRVEYFYWTFRFSRTKQEKGIHKKLVFSGTGRDGTDNYVDLKETNDNSSWYLHQTTNYVPKKKYT